MSGRNPYRSLYTTSTHRKELNLREEMHKTLYGANDEIAKGRTGLLRRLRRDSEGNKIKCPCKQNNTTEPSRNYYCRYCHGLGYYWDEYPVVYYRDSDAIKYIDGSNKEYITSMFYFEYTTVITDDDYILTLKRDNDGDILQPPEIERSYRILKTIKAYSDQGRVEYIYVRATEERPWSTWYGVKNRRL